MDQDWLRLVFSERWALLAATAAHLELVIEAVLMAVIVAVPLGILAARRPLVERAAVGITSVLQTIPSLALLALLLLNANRVVARERLVDELWGEQPPQTAVQIGVKPPTKLFALRYRAPYPGASAENAGAVAPSFSAAYAPLLPDALFKGKVVFIGAVARSAHADADSLPEDMHATPLRFLPGHFAGTPGVEIHVHALSQMLAGDSIRTPAPLVVGLIGIRAQLPKPLFWLALVAGVGLFAIRLNSNASWWTGHLVYFLPPR